MTLAERCGAQGPAREAACAALLERVQREGLAFVRVAWADLHGTLRGKTLVLPGPALEGALRDGIGMVSTVLLKDTSDRTAFKVFEPGALAALPGFGSANNVQLLPDPAAFHVLPWAPDTGWLRAEPFWDDGSALAADPRRVLQRALADLAERGLSLRCGLELEFHLHRIEGDALAPAQAGWPGEPPAVRHGHPGYRLLSEEHADLLAVPLATVRRTALALGMPLRSLEIELGPSQVEAVFAPTDALLAADQLLLFRSAVRQALRREGWLASFACVTPLPHAIASGWHLHQSLVDAEGRNAMVRESPAGAPDDARQVLSDLGAHWLAGLLAHAPALAAISAPSLNAYARYQGSVMAPQSAVWGRDNRGAMLRVIGAPGDTATRIENRLGEPLANPYLTMAAQVFAGLHGLQQRLAAPPAAENPYATAPTLPATLGEALDALARDKVLCAGLGAPMAGVYQAIKRQEIARHAQAADPAAWLAREYFGRF
ncbi:MAG: glutamine synthetase [Rubrivivax sp.]|nr:glutamine synthetase [Rubrivivax sp.]